MSSSRHCGTSLSGRAGPFLLLVLSLGAALQLACDDDPAAEAGSDAAVASDGAAKDAAADSSETSGLDGGVDRPGIGKPDPMKLDLLFVIDNSSGMLEEQDNMSAGFPALLQELGRIPGGAPDLHIAVISSNVGAGPGRPANECPPGGDRGAFQSLPRCDLAPERNGHYLTIDRAGRTNFEAKGGLPALPQVFECMATLGNNGCGYEHQLLSMYFALNGKTNPINAGFFRPDAYLGIILLSDEDDCSGRPTANFYDGVVAGQGGSLRCALRGHQCGGTDVPAAPFSTDLRNCAPYVQAAGEENSRLIDVKTFVDFVHGLKPNHPERILVSAIIGWSDAPDARYTLRSIAASRGPELTLDPACVSNATGAAWPGIRLHGFARSFKNNTVHSICADELGGAMAQIGSKLAGMYTGQP